MIDRALLKESLKMGMVGVAWGESILLYKNYNSVPVEHFDHLFYTTAPFFCFSICHYLICKNKEFAENAVQIAGNPEFLSALISFFIIVSGCMMTQGEIKNTSQKNGF